MEMQTEKQHNQRHYAVPRSFFVAHTGGDIFEAAHEASSHAVLWGETFKEKERSFLRQYLEEHQVTFGSRDTFQIEARVAWNPRAKIEFQKFGRIALASGLKCAVCLHGYTGRIKNSWGWAKMILPLWNQNYTVICIDMPGFGRSSMNMRHNVTPESWKPQDGMIVSKCISSLGFEDCSSLLAYGESCATAVRIMKQFPHLASRCNHVFVNPKFTLDDVHPIEAPYGAQQDWYDQLPGLQASQLTYLLGKAKIGMWTVFSKQGARGDPAADRYRKTMQVLVQKAESLGLEKKFRMHEVTKEFICEAAAGLNVKEERLLVLCKYFRDAFSGFIANKIKEIPREIPSWALEVASTVASSSMPSKSMPPIREVDVQATIQEVAEVLEREPPRGRNRPTSAASGQDQERLRNQQTLSLMNQRSNSRSSSRSSGGDQRRPSRSLPSLVPGQMNSRPGQRKVSLPQGSTDGFNLPVSSKSKELPKVKLSNKTEIQAVLARRPSTNLEMSMSMTQFKNSNAERVKSRNELAVQRSHQISGMLNAAAQRLNPFQDNSTGHQVGPSTSLTALEAGRQEQPQPKRRVRNWGADAYKRTPFETQAREGTMKRSAMRAHNTRVQTRAADPVASQTHYLTRNCKMVKDFMANMDEGSDSDDSEMNETRQRM
mmetsp:Transcript_30133/g.54595  ORF Transcript_30133/g.54595 Transcript_30133/m.54595 type:complete len:658 (+) Transcript_30133:111-2084(+)